MRAYFLQGLIIAAGVFIFSCSGDPEKKAEEKAKTPVVDSNQRLAKDYLTDCRKLYKEARSMDSVLLEQMEVDKLSADKALKAFTDFAFYCQSDSLSPVYLVKTAQVARSINNIPQAKAALDRCIELYPEFRDRSAALFLLAQLYDEPTYLNNEAEAKKLYEQIINDHPKSDWAASAKGAISFIGKSDAEILKELKKKR